MTKKSLMSTLKWIIGDILVPLTVGISAVYVAVQANHIAKLQAMIAKSSESPTIEVIAHSFLDNLESEMEDSIEITILDGKYSNYQSTIITFLTCRCCDINENHEFVFFKTYEIPIFNYYDIHVKSQSMYGKVDTIYTLQNSTWLWNLRNRAKVEYEQGSGFTFMTSVESYLRITYTNLLDEPEAVYYLLDGSTTTPAKQINEEFGQARFNEWGDMMLNGFEIYPDDTTGVLFRIFSLMDDMKDLYKGSIQ